MEKYYRVFYGSQNGYFRIEAINDIISFSFKDYLIGKDISYLKTIYPNCIIEPI